MTQNDSSTQTIHDGGNDAPQPPQDSSARRPAFNMDDLPDLRDNAPDPDALRKAEFTTVYDIIDSLEEMITSAKGSMFSPSSVKIDRDDFLDKLEDLKTKLPVQLVRIQNKSTGIRFMGINKPDPIIRLNQADHRAGHISDGRPVQMIERKHRFHTGSLPRFGINLKTAPGIFCTLLEKRNAKPDFAGFTGGNKRICYLPKQCSIHSAAIILNPDFQPVMPGALGNRNTDHRGLCFNRIISNIEYVER